MPPRKTAAKVPSRPVSEHPHSWRSLGGVFAASLAMIVMAPVFVLAVEPESPQSDDGTVVGIVRELRKDVAELRAQMRSIDAKVEALGSSVADPALSGAGVADCLASCQAQGIACLKSPAAPPTTGLSNLTTTTTPPTVIAKENACRRNVDRCVQSCRPRTNAVVTPSCETSCAVSLDACVRAAGNNVDAAQRCRIANRFCLADRCMRPAPTSLVVGASKVPAGTCVSQCRRAHAMCADRVKFDAQGMAECDAVLKVCEEVACKDDDQPIGDEITAQCEDACTATFNKCRTTAGKNESALKACDAPYGQCRDACRRQVGGGEGTIRR